MFRACFGNLFFCKIVHKNFTTKLFWFINTKERNREVTLMIVANKQERGMFWG